MRKKPAMNCKGCKARTGYMKCSLSYSINKNHFNEQVPSGICPKPTTTKALDREIKRNDQATDPS